MKVAIVGCAHGELEKIYETIAHLEERERMTVDLIICCGDFQSIRNHDDLQCMAVSQKYRQLNSFHKYYSGRARKHRLTLFVGGNHEASNYLSELPNGGWVAPGIYYMGFANVLRVGSLRIGGVSGIYGKNGNDDLKGHFECPPYNDDTLRSVYHVRQLDSFRMKQLRTKNDLDIVFSHDWPRGIEQFGDTEQLLRFKEHFYEDISRGQLGNPLTQDLLRNLKPRYWFSAHLHAKFAAVVRHENDGRETRFLALDKCLPNKQFVQILDIGAPLGKERLEPEDFRYDEEWLAILRSTNHLISTSNRAQYMPGPFPGSTVRHDFTPTDQELEEIRARFPDSDGGLKIPGNFKQTAPPLNDGEAGSSTNQFGNHRQKYYVNPQSTEFCDKLGITNLNSLLAKTKLRPQDIEEAWYLREGATSTVQLPEASSSASASVVNICPEEIPLDDEEDEDRITGTSSDEIIIDRSMANQKRASEEPEASEGESMGSSTMKKFKRRNADLYTTNTEEDD